MDVTARNGELVAVVEAVAVLQDVAVEAVVAEEVETDLSGWTNMGLQRVQTFALLWKISPAA